MINIYAIRSELTRMEGIYKKILRALQDAPEGLLYYRKGRNGEPRMPYLVTHQDGIRKRRSLRKESVQLIRRLKYKTYAKHMKRTVENNIKALKGMLNYSPLGEAFTAFGGEAFAECRSYFFGEERPKNKEFDELQERQNTSYSEELKVDTDLGVFRSKLEYITAQILVNLGLSFKYETPLWTGTRYRYPDFCVLHPGTGEIVYLEVAGKMKDSQYRIGLLNRIHEYGNAGVYLGINLFVITEDPDAGIDIAALTEQIRGIFSL